MNITCYYSERLQLTKSQCEAIGKGIVILMKAVNDIWENIKETASIIFEEFYKVEREFKKPNYFVKAPYLKSQVLDNKPKFVRIRNNC